MHIRKKLDIMKQINELLESFNSKKDQIKSKAKTVKNVAIISSLILAAIAILKKFISFMGNAKTKGIESSEEQIREAKKLQNDLDSLGDKVKSGVITEKQAIKEYEKTEKKIISLLKKTNDKYLESVIEDLTEGETNETFVYLLEKVIDQKKNENDEFFQEGESILNTLGKAIEKKIPEPPKRVISPDKISDPKLIKLINSMADKIKKLEEDAANGAVSKKDITKLQKEVMEMKNTGVSPEEFEKFKRNAIHAVKGIKSSQETLTKNVDALKTQLDKSVASCNKKITAGNILSAAAIILSSIALCVTFCGKFKGRKNKKIEKLTNELNFLESQVKSTTEQIQAGTMKPDTGALKIKSLNVKMEKISKNLSKLTTDVKESVLYDIDYINFLKENEDELSEEELNDTFLNIITESINLGMEIPAEEIVLESTTDIYSTCEKISSMIVESMEDSYMKKAHLFKSKGIISNEEFENLLYS